MPLPCHAASAQLRLEAQQDPGKKKEEWALNQIIAGKLLDVVFQPILGLRSRNHLGFEALIRPRENALLHNPTELFAAAERCGMTTPLDRVCREITLRRFAALGLPGTLFLNTTPNSLFDPDFQNGVTQALMNELRLPPTRVVIEITENQKILDFSAFRDVLDIFRHKGYRIAIDDFGQGMANLQMWTEIHPDIVKIDRHFIDGIAQDPLKFQLVRAVQGMAETCGAFLVAEGIEQEEDFLAVRDIGIHFAQGFLIARPSADPERAPSARIRTAMSGSRIPVFPSQGMSFNTTIATRALLKEIPAIAPGLHCEEVFQRFETAPELQELAVVSAESLPLGLILRSELISDLARPFRRELYGRRPCNSLMNASPLLVDESMPLQDLARLVTRTAKTALHESFIITESGRYLGIGRSQDMLALLTDMQIRAARYANPLTQLPGNVPIDEHIARLLASGAGFVACYADLDAFKPFNDVYGYRRGDDLIQLLGEILVETSDPREDFVGHIGGDDFLVLFQSQDWQARCQRALTLFEHRVSPLLAEEDIARGGIITENRLGQRVQHGLPSLSLGAVPVEFGQFFSHHEISAAAAEAKKQAKRVAGNSLFVERRKPQTTATPDPSLTPM